MRFGAFVPQGWRLDLVGVEQEDQWSAMLGVAKTIEAAGTPEQLVAKLEPWAAAGMGYCIVYFPEAAYDTSGLELFARDVMPALG